MTTAEMRMRRSAHRRVGSAGIATALVASIVGCSHSPGEKAKKGLESLHSWAVSTQMVGERWLQRAVPDPYVGKTLDSFGRKMRKQRTKIASGTLPADVKRYLISGFDSTALAAESLRVRVESGERGDVARIVSGLSARAQSADSVKARLNGT
ncbi:MAG TPA: hypothetical protein VFR95_03485 [Gemmatimonadaceae bacterium]|nr:hypothetical protein [Gemmatimonadaceae bacterium]